MDIEELFHHTLTCLPEAVGDLMRAERDPSEFVFASFDGASELGMALIASDIASQKGLEPPEARADVARMIASAGGRGEELVVSLMVTKDVLHRILAVAEIDPPTRVAVRVWLDGPLDKNHYRVLAIVGDQIRAAAVDGELENEESPVSSSMLN
jgi:hypothetical protein